MSTRNFRQQQFFLRNTLRGSSLVQVLIYANLILFSLMVLHGTILGMGMNAILRPDNRLLYHWGAQVWEAVFSYGQWWRCITYAFTHGGVIHLGFNMLVLYQIGPMLEAEIGAPRLLTVYTVCTLAATFAVYVWHPNVLSVGASGAILGLIGFSISFYHRVGGSIGLYRRNFMLQWAAMTIIYGFVVNQVSSIRIDNSAHIGGLIAGLVIGWFMPINIRAQRRSDGIFKVIALACALLIIICITFIPISWIMIKTH